MSNFAEKHSNTRTGAKDCPSCSYLQHQHGAKGPNGSFYPASGTDYVATFADGSVKKGKLDGEGKATHEAVHPGIVKIEYEPAIWEQINTLHRKLKKLLDEIVADEKKEAAAIEAELAKKSWAGRAGEYAKAAGRGAWKTVTGLWDFVSGLAKELSKRSNPIYYILSGTAQKDAQALEKLGKKIQNIDVSAEDIMVFWLISMHPGTHKLVTNFAADFIAAQHALEVTEGAGMAVGEIIITLVTAGVGNIRHAAKLKQVSKLLKELAPLIKKSLMGRKKVTATNRTVITKQNKHNHVPKKKTEVPLKIPPKLPKKGSLINGVRIKDVKQGTNGKVAIIGQGMTDSAGKGRGVVDVADTLKKQGHDVELFTGKNIPSDAQLDWNRRVEAAAPEQLNKSQMIKSKMFKANKKWVQKLKNEGYSVIDIGNPQVKNNSPFYDMENEVIFGK